MDWLKCNICFNIYNDSSLRPRSLTCGHTFCERCLNNTIENKSLTCPQCRKIHEIHSAIDLPINFIVEGLLKSLNPGSEDLKEGIVMREIDKEINTNYSSSEACSSLKSHMEKQERSLLAQKELLKSSAGMCNEHPSMECMLRCSVHKCWICEHCTEDQGDHPINKCKIKSFVKELEDRRQEHITSLIDDRNSCDVTKSIIEKHISDLKDEKEQHTWLIDNFQDLVNIHKKEEESLENEIKLFQNIIENSENIKLRILDVETIVVNATTLDESNAAKDVVKNNKKETTNWVNISKKEVNEGKVKVEKAASLAMASNISLNYRYKCLSLQQDLCKKMCKSEEEASEIKSRCIDLTKSPICYILTPKKLTKLVTCLKTFATYTHEDCQRCGRIISADGKVLLEDFRKVLTPGGALVINVNDMIEDLSHPRCVFLSFISINGEYLGRIILRVNEDAPRRAQQLIDLSVGQKGLSYSGTSDIYLAAKGKPDERLLFFSYLDAKNEIVKENIFPDLEKSEKIAHKQGLVIFNNDGDNAVFRILTKSCQKKYWKGPAIAEVVEGMPILEKIAEDTLVTGNLSESQVIISGSGLVINSNECENFD